MTEEIKVPPMGESINEADVGVILKDTGSLVSIDDEILELETDKVNQVIYATADGQLTLNVSQGDKVSVGDLLASIDTSVKVEKKEKESVKEIVQEEKREPLKGESIRKGDRAFIASLDEKPNVLEEKAFEGSRGETRQRLPKIRRVIADRLLESVKTSAMLTTFNEVDMTRIIEIRAQEKEQFIDKYGVKLGFMSFFVKACVSALYAYPAFNTFIDGDELVQRNYIDIGVAVGTDKGLYVPVIRNCDTLSMADIEKAIGQYAKSAREGKLSHDDLIGGSFTITNGGTYGSMLSTPILNPPQCGILGMHNIVKRAVVVEDEIVIRPIMYLALSYDHRVVDGKEAVSFLVHIKQELEEPSRLLLDL